MKMLVHLKIAAAVIGVWYRLVRGLNAFIAFEIFKGMT